MCVCVCSLLGRSSSKDWRSAGVMGLASSEGARVQYAETQMQRGVSMYRRAQTALTNAPWRTFECISASACWSKAIIFPFQRLAMSTPTEMPTFSPACNNSLGRPWEPHREILGSLSRYMLLALSSSGYTLRSCQAAADPTIRGTRVASGRARAQVGISDVEGFKKATVAAPVAGRPDPLPQSYGALSEVSRTSS